MNQTPDLNTIADTMAQELQDLIDDAIEASNDQSALMPAQLILDEYHQHQRMHRLMIGAGQGGPFVRAVTRCVYPDSAGIENYGIDDWQTAYINGADPGWTSARFTTYDHSQQQQQTTTG